MSESLIPSFLVSDVSESLRSLTKNERCEQLWANRSGRSSKMSEWVNRSCFWANRSFFWANRSFAHFGQKMSHSLGKLMTEFPALALWWLIGGYLVAHWSEIRWLTGSASDFWGRVHRFESCSISSTWTGLLIAGNFISRLTSAGTLSWGAVTGSHLDVCK